MPNDTRLPNREEFYRGYDGLIKEITKTSEDAKKQEESRIEKEHWKSKCPECGKQGDRNRAVLKNEIFVEEGYFCECGCEWAIKWQLAGANHSASETYPPIPEGPENLIFEDKFNIFPWRRR